MFSSQSPIRSIGLLRWPLCQIRRPWPLWRTNRWNFIPTFRFFHRNVLNLNLLLKSLTNIFPLNFFCFLLGILFYELIYMHEPTANSAKDLIAFLNFNINTLRAKLINSLWLPQEHDFQLISFGIRIEVRRKVLVNKVFLPSNVNGLSTFIDIPDDHHQLLNLLSWLL